MAAAVGGLCFLSPASTDGLSASLPPNMTLTENASYTFASTTSFCLDFYFEVMQNTAPDHIVKMLETAWQENAALTLKLIFQLRDIRRGKAAKLEFYHCLSWLYKNHFQTLLKNLEHLPKHGYWKDLLWLVHYALTGQVVLVTKQQVGAKQEVIAEKMETEEQQLDYKTVTLEEMIRKRVDAVISRETWNAYRAQLPDQEAKKNADKKMQELSKEIHKQRRKETLARHSAQKRDVTNQIANLMEKNEKFSPMYKGVVRIFTTALKHDVEVLDKKERLESTALAGKWAPSIGGSYDLSTQLGRNIARSLFREKTAGETVQDYDKKAFISYQSKYLAPLRDEIAIVEKYMSKRKWSEINYERVPSVAMKRYKKIFYARDEEHFKEFIEAVKKGEKKIASGALLPHEIVNELMKVGQVQELEDVSEMQWKSYVDNLKKVGLFESALAVCDVSGSMSGEPMSVAIALSLLIAALSKPPFNGLICSFSATPQLHAVNQPTLKEKVSFTSRMDWGMNTNMQAVFNLILNKAIAAKLPANEMVKTIFIFSDMEFDECGGKQYETDYMLIQRKFQEAGYPLPGIVFWNLRGGNRSKPVTMNEKNVAMVSGFSGQMLRTFLENGKFNSPYETMLDTLGKHYDHLEVVD